MEVLAGVGWRFAQKRRWVRLKTSTPQRCRHYPRLITGPSFGLSRKSDWYEFRTGTNFVTHNPYSQLVSFFVQFRVRGVHQPLTTVYPEKKEKISNVESFSHGIFVRIQDLAPFFSIKFQVNFCFLPAKKSCCQVKHVISMQGSLSNPFKQKQDLHASHVISHEQSAFLKLKVGIIQ